MDNETRDYLNRLLADQRDRVMKQLESKSEVRVFAARYEMVMIDKAIEALGE